MSDDCEHARAQLDSAQGEVREAFEKWQAAEEKKVEARGALAQRKEEAEAAGREADEAESAVSRARETLGHQEAQLVGYPGSEANLDELRRGVERATDALRAANEKKYTAAEAVKDAESELDGKVHTAQDAATAHGSAKERADNWQQRVNQVCGS